ncbi:CPBP family intramembrane metalloprotease [Planomonospora sp. ID67723]|uniref:CPBP family intramembrane glutamic endopeptidase n=1 Tax=Planomonospora sp. ID67723 TaxID=2738134 RepID=UPI0018C415A0|nr:CPBP family intramembrane glutamic endopeptidase [Planomonospora sp. ID67723]MBG0826311.1 CPBP family intramembrane metalloprotease [Planomonospora sp. ID67723]
MTTASADVVDAAEPRRPVPRLRAWINFAVFSAVTVGGGWLFVALDRATGEAAGTGSVTSASGGTNGQGLWIAVPALTALALYFLSRDGAGPLGLTLRFADRTRWFAFAAVFSPVTAAVSVAAATAAGVATFSVTPSAGGPSLPVAFATALGFLVVKNLLEEFIFRGYGTRTAMALGLRGVAPHALVGLVWGLWHLPLYTVWMSQADFRRSTTLPWSWYLPTFLAGIVVMAVLYGEMRVRTGSIWPGVVLHTVGNALTTPLLVNGHLDFEGHGDALFGVAGNSVVSILLFGGAGLFLLHRRNRGGGPAGT